MRIRAKGPIAKARARKRAKDVRYAKRVREEVALRDGYCRIALDIGLGLRCAGVSEWAHWRDWQRFKTRGKPPEGRHSTKGSLMLCTRHHRLYDNGRIDIEATDEVRGCDGPLSYLSTPLELTCV